MVMRSWLLCVPTSMRFFQYINKYICLSTPVVVGVVDEANEMERISCIGWLDFTFLLDVVFVS